MSHTSKSSQKNRSIKLENPIEIYPTEWQGGIPRGSIQDKGNFYRVVMSAPGVAQYSKPFYSSKPKRGKCDTPDQICKNKDEAFLAAERYRNAESMKHGITRNIWRKIDENTIEVKIDDDKTFFTDYDNVDKVEQYPVFAKKVHNKFHVVSQDKKKQFNFYTLIKPTINIVEYIDNDPFNLRLSNIRELGTVEIATKVKEKIDVDKCYDFDIDHYSLTKYTDMPYVLPKNTWILGKPAGTIFEKDSYIVVRISTGEKYASKTFKFNETNKDSQHELAKKWQYTNSYKLGMTKNLIKILDNKYIEVQITKNNVFRTNIEFIIILQSIPLFTTTGRSGKSDPYPATNINGKNMMYYNLITCNKMTDHIDGDTMNNTLENLRSCDHSPNYTNCHLDDDEISNEKIDGRGNRYIQTIVYIKNHSIQKKFYFKKEEKETAIKNAKAYRNFILYGEWDESLLKYITYDDCMFVYNYCDELMNHHNSNIISRREYIDTIVKTIGSKLPSITESSMYSLYLKTRTEHSRRYNDTIFLVSKLMDTKISAY